MKTAVIIPARYASTRFPAKSLALLKGRPMILWVAEKAKQAFGDSGILAVATDDKRIAEVVEKAGYQAVMTAESHPTGSDRIREAASKLGLSDEDLILNVQGDEPETRPEWLGQLRAAFENQPDLNMATLAHTLDAEDLESLNAVKLLVDARGRALYFSRFPIPFSRLKPADLGLNGPVLKHMGFYAYRKSFLDRFCEAPPSYLEKAESLEQLRALEMGERIQVCVVKGKSRGVDTPEDLAKIEASWRDDQ